MALKVASAFPRFAAFTTLSHVQVLQHMNKGLCFDSFERSSGSDLLVLSLLFSLSLFPFSPSEDTNMGLTSASWLG